MSTLKIKRENGKIFCPLADSWHIETPEEKVRQEYIKILERIAAREKLTFARGIYAAMSGPSYETPAEIRMLSRWGADAVGMSTVPEAIVARQRGVKVAGISCITNLAAGISPEPLSHKEVVETAERVKRSFMALLSESVPLLG